MRMCPGMEVLCKQLHSSAEVACWRCIPLNCAVLRVQKRQGELAGQASMLEELDKGFSRTGVQSFALEGILGELQVFRSGHFACTFHIWYLTATMQEKTVIFLGCSPMPLLHAAIGNVTSHTCFGQECSSKPSHFSVKAFRAGYRQTHNDLAAAGRSGRRCSWSSSAQDFPSSWQPRAQPPQLAAPRRSASARPCTCACKIQTLEPLCYGSEASGKQEEEESLQLFQPTQG